MKSVIRQSERIYSLILSFYPKKYRQEYGEEMKYVFSESLKDAYAESGETGIISFWTRAIVDAGKSLMVQNLDNLKGGGNMNKGILNNSFVRAGLGTALILSLPLVGMQLSSDVNWSLSDFVIMGVIVFITGLMLDLAMKKAGKYRVGAILVILFMFVWLWAELAVGVFTNWGS